MSKRRMSKKKKKDFHPRDLSNILKKTKKCLISGIGGGGDCITALYVKWSLEQCFSHIEWIHGGVTISPLKVFQNIEIIDDNSAWVTEKSQSQGQRLIEAVLSRWIGEKVLLLSAANGARQMARSLNRICNELDIDLLMFIDGGSDCLAFVREKEYLSLIEDTITLAALGFGNFTQKVRHVVIGLAAVGSDGEMSLDEISDQLLKIAKAGGFLGGTFFPMHRLEEYATLISMVLKKYQTGTALAPLQVTNTKFESPGGWFNPFINGFQLATFFLDARIAARIGNDFAAAVLEATSCEDALKKAEKILTNKNT